MSGREWAWEPATRSRAGRGADSRWSEYADINAVKVLSDGIPA